MPSVRIYNTEAIVLRASPLGEADRLLTLLTPGLGKLQATARGVRKPTSKLGGHLDLLTRSSLTVAKGQSLDTITGAEAQETFPLVKGNLERLSRAIYLSELMDSFCPLEAPSPAVYTLFLDGLRALGVETDSDLLLRYMELQLLSLSGFLPELQRCAECHNSVAPSLHLWSPAAGGVVCPSCSAAHSDAANLSLNALKVMRFISTATVSSATMVRVNAPLHRELAAIMDAYLRFTLEREMRSAAFLRTVSRARAYVGLPTSGNESEVPAGH
ncbi:MAG: DNA repair protein RecO [Dehalococcoidia bacterium]|nr:DNA repair protein RecO [Dehalococcoidia bacterium]